MVDVEVGDGSQFVLKETELATIIHNVHWRGECTWEMIIEALSHGYRTVAKSLTMRVDKLDAMGYNCFEFALELGQVGVRAEVLQLAGDLGVLRLLTAAPHA